MDHMITEFMVMILYKKKMIFIEIFNYYYPKLDMNYYKLISD